MNTLSWSSVLVTEVICVTRMPSDTTVLESLELCSLLSQLCGSGVIFAGHVLLGLEPPDQVEPCFGNMLANRPRILGIQAQMTAILSSTALDTKKGTPSAVGRQWVSAT